MKYIYDNAFEHLASYWANENFLLANLEFYQLQSDPWDLPHVFPLQGVFYEIRGVHIILLV